MAKKPMATKPMAKKPMKKPGAKMPGKMARDGGPMPKVGGGKLSDKGKC